MPIVEVGDVGSGAVQSALQLVSLSGEAVSLSGEVLALLAEAVACVLDPGAVGLA